MNRFRLAAIAAAVLLAPSIAAASDFPPEATVPSAADLASSLADRVFTVQPADGSTWRVQFKGPYVFVDTDRGFRGDGTWNAEEGRLCMQLRRRDPSCNDARIQDGVVHLRRASGEIVRYQPR